MTSATEPILRPAGVSLGERLSVGPLRLWLVLAVMLVGAFLLVAGLSGNLVRVASGEAPPEMAQDFRVGIVLALMLAFLPAGELFSTRRAQQSLALLAPLLPLGADELEAHRLQLERTGRRGTLLAAAAGVTFVMVGGFLPEAIAERSLGLDQLGAMPAAHRLMGIALGMAAGSSIRLAVRNSRLLGRWAAERGHLDLLEPTAFSPLARLGLTNAYVSAGVVSLTLLLLPDREAGVGLGAMLAFMIAVSVVMGAIGLVLPMLPLRERIRAERQAELTRCNRRVAELRRGPASAGELADAIAYRGLVEDVSEWPIDLPQLGRFGLVFGLPVASWVAAAFVERLIDAAMG